MPEPRPAKVTLSRCGLVLGDEVVPLHSGSVHYFRHSRALWKTILSELAALGARLVDTYVPWGVHEVSRGVFDFGSRDPRLDVVAFLETAAELGLRAIVRPGPHINAELTYFGIPERIVWDPGCQARSAAGQPVILPVPPLAFPVPSHASATYHAEAAVWLRAVAEQLAPLVWPDGPIVLAQVDNEGSLFFRDGPYDQDYHPDAIAQYRRFLRTKYRTSGALRAAHSDSALDFDVVDPPRRMDASDAQGLARHLDWAEFQEAMLEGAMYRFSRVLGRHGLGGVPRMHNLPIAERATALDPMRIARAVDFVSLDYYHAASAGSRREIAARTTHLAVRGEASHRPAFAAELGAGFAPTLPPMSVTDNAFTALMALAYGLRGFNLYMAVQRDRWIGGPIDERGRRRPSADFWSRLFAALSRTRFHELSRAAPVHLVFPRALDRLCRVCHAFGPLPPVVFELLGGMEIGSALELAAPAPGAAAEAQRFLDRLSEILDTLRVPHARVQSDLAPHSLEHARWTIFVSPGALDPGLVSGAIQRVLTSSAVSFGPRAPEYDEAFRPVGARLPRIDGTRAPLILDGADPDLAGLVDRTVSALGIARLEAEPEGIHTTLHEDAGGKARVLFVINTTDRPLECVARAPGARKAKDALDGEDLLVTGEHVVVTVPALSVRMVELLGG